MATQATSPEGNDDASPTNSSSNENHFIQMDREMSLDSLLSNEEDEDDDGSLNGLQDESCAALQFCTKDNMNQCLEYLRSELATLRYPFLEACRDGSKFDTVMLVNIFYDFIRLHITSTKDYEELQMRLTKAFNEITHLSDKCSHMKEQLEQKERVISQQKEKERQLNVQIGSLQNKLRKECIENKKQKSVLDHRKDQFQHELKKKEREIMQLKERLHQSLMDKNSERKQAIELINVLPRTDGQRKKWRTTSSSAMSENDLNSMMISSFKAQQNELLGECQDLKNSLMAIHQEISSVLTQLNITNVPEESHPCSLDNMSRISDSSLTPSDTSQARSLQLCSLSEPSFVIKENLEISIMSMLSVLKEHIESLRDKCISVPEEVPLPETKDDSPKAVEIADQSNDNLKNASSSQASILHQDSCWTLQNLEGEIQKIPHIQE